MATYITTLKFTPLGMQAIEDSPKRAAAFKAAAKKMGIKVTGAYWTMGARGFPGRPMSGAALSW